MLSDLEIKNFRTFKHLRIRRLGQVNLILGNNNVGKTTLLEALQIYGSAWPAPTAAEILEYRGEVVGTIGPAGALSFEAGSFLNLEALFHGRGYGKVTQAFVGPATDGSNLPALAITGTVENDVSVEAGVPVVPQNTTRSIPPGPQLTLRFQSGRASSKLYRSRRVHYETIPPELAALAGVNPRPALLRLTNSESMAETAGRWDAIANLRDRRRVIHLLDKVYPVDDLAFVGQPVRTAKLWFHEGAGFMPLMSAGEGMVRMLHIATALCAAKSSEAPRPLRCPANVFPLVLIDEIDAGIHHSHHADLWRFVLEAAHELGVQVLATTHSWDCLRGLAEAVKNVPECDALAVRLEKVEGKDRTGAVIIDRDDLPIVVRETIEVR